MRYVIRERFFRLGEDSDITDEQGQPVLIVDGKVLTLHDRLILRDPSGQEVAQVSRGPFALRPTYQITVGGREAAEVRGHLFTPFGDRFDIALTEGDALELHGNLLEHEFTVQHGERIIATISKRWISLTETYGVEIGPGEDYLLILATILALDLARDRRHEADHVAVG